MKNKILDKLEAERLLENVKHGILIIPDDEYNEISENAFSNSDLKVVVIGKGIQTIGTEAFLNCNNLTTVLFEDDSLKTIGEHAFYGCQELFDIHLPMLLSEIGKGAFGYCSDLRKINIPMGITNIYEDTFCSCYSLEQVIFENPTIEVIGARAFAWCNELKYFNLKSVKKIQDEAFLHTGSMISVANEFPENVIEIGDNAFAESEIFGNIKLPKTLKTIGTQAFKATKINSITIPKSVTQTGINIFVKCEGLTTIKIGTKAMNCILEKELRLSEKIDGENILIINENKNFFSKIFNAPSLKELIIVE